MHKSWERIIATARFSLRVAGIDLLIKRQLGMDMYCGLLLRGAGAHWA
jgi:hypothetical protein